MLKYRLLMTTNLGVKDSIVFLPNDCQTEERLKRGLVELVADESKPAENKIDAPTEKKARKPRAK